MAGISRGTSLSVFVIGAIVAGCVSASGATPSPSTPSPPPPSPQSVASASPSPSPSPSQSPIATASAAATPRSSLTIVFWGDGFAVNVPEPLQSGYIMGEGVERWEATSDSGQRMALAIHTIRNPPAAQQSLDGLAAAIRQQLAAQQGVTITSDERVKVAAGTAQRIAAKGGGEWTIFYLLYKGGKGFMLEMLNLTMADEGAIMETFVLV